MAKRTCPGCSTPHATRHIRHWSTQGTNALIERKGPLIGLITDNPGLAEEINRLTTAGAERLIVAAQSLEREQLYKRAMLKNFPRHLLGSVPILFSWEFATDTLRSRQIWSMARRRSSC